MALTPRDNEAFYREVDDELRRDQLMQGWQRYGKLMIGGVILVLAAIGGVIYWNYHRDVVAGQKGEALTAALTKVQTGAGKHAVPQLDDLAGNDSHGYRGAALLAKANVQLQDGNEKGALATLQSISDDSSAAEAFRQLALVRRTAIEFDRLPPAQVIDRLKPMATAGNPWFGSAGEMVALAYLKQGKAKQAAPLFASLARDDQVPPSVRTRAMQMAGSLGVDATQPVKVVKELSE